MAFDPHKPIDEQSRFWRWLPWAFVLIVIVAALVYASVA
jgi:hypothetical protein